MHMVHVHAHADLYSVYLLGKFELTEVKVRLLYFTFQTGGREENSCGWILTPAEEVYST